MRDKNTQGARLDGKLVFGAGVQLRRCTQWESNFASTRRRRTSARAGATQKPPTRECKAKCRPKECTRGKVGCNAGFWGGSPTSQSHAAGVQLLKRTPWTDERTRRGQHRSHPHGSARQKATLKNAQGARLVFGAGAQFAGARRGVQLRKRTPRTDGRKAKSKPKERTGGKVGRGVGFWGVSPTSQAHAEGGTTHAPGQRRSHMGA